MPTTGRPRSLAVFRKSPAKYQEGYFRQFIDATGAQQEVFPFNDPGSID
jgi:hypothetical protein